MALKGQLSLYKPEYDREVFELCLLGKKDTEIAEYLGVATSTFYLWKKEFKSLSEAVKNGKDRADKEIVSALRQRARGMEVEEEHITIEKDGSQTVKKIKRKLPPDPTSMIFWLKNRQKDNWKSRTSLDPLDKDGQSISFKVDYGDNSTVQPKPNVETLPSGDTEGPETGKGFSNTASARKDKSSDG